MSHTRPRIAFAFLVVALVLAAPARGRPGERPTDPVERELRMMDADRDGRISPGEHAAGARKMFEAMDASGDARVTAAEMDAAHERVTGQKPKEAELSAAEKIAVVDTDRDGVLSAEEHSGGSAAMFEKMDTNRDGFLTKAELAAGHRKMLRKGK